MEWEAYMKERASRRHTVFDPTKYPTTNMILNPPA